jgi:gliding motility-associated-like protein
MPAQSAAIATGLINDTYSVVVTDANLCSTTGQVQVLLGPPIQIQTVTQDITCFNQNNGQSTVIVTGGTPGFTYQWSTLPVQNSVTATSLAVGTYTIVVTDSRNCIESRTIQILQPLPLQISTTSTDVLCFGQSTGAVSVSGFGGTNPYSFTWHTTPVRTTQTVTGLPAGLYNVTITDNQGCMQLGQATIRQPQPMLAVTAFIQPSCFGGNNGQVSVVPSGGVAPYTYLWSMGQTTSTAINLATGTYSVTITDANACVVQALQILPQPMPLQITVNGSDLTCVQPANNGSAWVNASGGTSPYQYLWTGGSNPNQATNTGLASGTWGVQVTDANGCMQQGSVVLQPAQRPVAIVGPDTFFCQGSGGAPIWGSAQGGNPPYTYSWTPNNGALSNAFIPNPWANPDSSTTFWLTVTDDAGCSNLQPAGVRVFFYPLPIVDAGPDMSFCADGPAVFIQGQVVNALPGGYDVQWLPVQDLFCSTCFTTYATPSVSTIYTLRVRHIPSGCSSDSTTLSTLSSVVVTVKPRPIADAGPDTTICQTDSAVLCGTATGVGPLYTWNWSPALGLLDSSAQCTPASPPHSFTYYLIATSDGCESLADSILLSVIPVPEVDAGNVKNICPGDSIALDGNVQQLGQHVYQWLPSAGLNNAGILQPMASPSATQWYYLTASASGCAGNTDSVLLIVHPLPIANAGQDTVICDTISGLILNGNYTGGAQPVRAEWSPAASLSSPNLLQPLATPLVTTLYYLTVSNGTPPTVCSTTDSVLVTVLPSLNLTTSQDTGVICFGGSVQLQSQAGQGNAQFQWSPITGLDDAQSTSPQASPAVTTSYVLTVTEGQCTASDTLLVQVHPQVQADFTMSQPIGCGNHTVQFQNLSANALTYRWIFDDQSPVSNQIQEQHTYSQTGSFYPQLIVMGVGGCRDTFISSVPVVVHPRFEVKGVLFPQEPAELQLPNAQISVVNNSERAVSHLWDFGDGRQSDEKATLHTYTLPGIYYVRLESMDSSGCMAQWESAPVIVKAPELFVPNVFTPNGDGVNDDFKVEYSGHELYLLNIFDRWGVKVFETRNANQNWNGLDLNGSKVIPGVYFWNLETGDQKYRGDVSVVY